LVTSGFEAAPHFINEAKMFIAMFNAAVQAMHDASSPASPVPPAP
jgi:hypothetical protein